MSSKGYRIGFIVVLVLAVLGLVTSVGLSVQLGIARNTLARTHDQLSVTEDSLATKAAELASTEGQLKSTATQLAETEAELAEKEEELALYKDTWGSVVSSEVRPPFKGADIVNNETATNPTWAELLDFVLNDETDEQDYVPDVYMCGDFARDVHNNAELAGIRTAWVAIKFSDGYHSLNAFKTTDKGLVFIDCTGLKVLQSGPSNCDKSVNVRLGRSYRPRSLFPESGWRITWDNMGTVRDVQIYW